MMTMRHKQRYPKRERCLLFWQFLTPIFGARSKPETKRKKKEQQKSIKTVTVTTMTRQDMQVHARFALTSSAVLKRQRERGRNGRGVKNSPGFSKQHFLASLVPFLILRSSLFIHSSPFYFVIELISVFVSIYTQFNKECNKIGIATRAVPFHAFHTKWRHVATLCLRNFLCNCN